jgi:uncharacterized protein YrzB (UPF0473 family)
METNIIELIDENNEVVQFEHLLTLDFGDREYIALLPVESIDDEDEEIIILRVEQDDEGNDIYVSIDDEEELQEVFQAFLQVVDDEEGIFVDDEEEIFEEDDEE